MQEYWARIAGGAVGTVFGLMIASLGFWRTVFVLVCGVLGVFAGAYLENHGWRR